MKLGFVVLNYLNYQILLDCINKLLLIDGIEKCQIAIVDNGSPNDSYKVIKDAFSNIDNVFVIKSVINSGYAKGNNVGYFYLKQKCGCDTIIIMNSDVLIEDKSFLSKLADVVKNNGDVAVVAPDVVNLNGSHCNPFGLSFLSVKTARISIIKNSILYFFIKLGFDIQRKNKISSNYRPPIICHDEYREDFVPHGSFIIFLRSWVDNEDRAFCPDTFLFCEENILFSYLKEKEYKILYSPLMQAVHCEDGSIKMETKSNKKKALFTIKNQNKSLKNFIRFMKKPLLQWNKSEPFDLTKIVWDE